MNFRCIDDLRNHLLAKFAENVDDMALVIEPEICPPEMDGDITVNCFRFARALKSNPMEVAKLAAEFLSDHEDVESAEGSNK
jgi:arginyl-tRNA synthetase